MRAWQGTRFATHDADVGGDGERLVPGRTQGIAELVRHRSSYLFFRKVLEVDRRRPVSVVDLGCGVGHGCVTLAQLDGVSVVGVDKSLDAIKYARKWYSHPNVRYEESDLRDFIPHMDEFDYVVSRNAFEHVADGLNLALATRWRWRLMIDVPYDEPSQANPHHSVYSIREASFSEFKNAELFFQNLDGRIFDARARPQRPNVIICVSSRDGELPVTELVSFPFAPWKPPRVRDRTRLQVERAAVLAGRARRAVRAAWRR